MISSIKVRQNEDKSIAMLGAQRKLYSDVKGLNSVRSLFSLWLPFVLSLMLLFVPQDSIFGTLFYSVSVLSLIVSCVLRNVIKRKKKLAASIQQQFDIYVFGMQWNKRLFGRSKNLDDEISEYSHRLFRKKGEKEKLYNWYTIVDDCNGELENISLCQRENIWWDSGLRRRYRIISCCLFGILALIVVVIGFVNNENVIVLTRRIAFIAPMFQWLIDTIGAINDDIDELEELSNELDDNKGMSMIKLQEIQRMIFEHRMNCYVLPDLIYKLFKNADDNKVRRIVHMNKEN